MDLMVIMGIVLVLMETIMVVYWYVMDSIGGMLNPIGKMPKTHCKKLMVYNGILLETIIIFVMVSVGPLLFF